MSGPVFASARRDLGFYFAFEVDRDAVERDGTGRVSQDTDMATNPVAVRVNGVGPVGSRELYAEVRGPTTRHNEIESAT